MMEVNRGKECHRFRLVRLFFILAYTQTSLFLGVVLCFLLIVNRLTCAGTVTVSKMPALHPGDVRKLEAVAANRVPGLTHMRDVIVFPRKVILTISHF